MYINILNSWQNANFKHLTARFELEVPCSSPAGVDDDRAGSATNELLFYYIYRDNILITRQNSHTKIIYYDDDGTNVVDE